MKFTLRILLQTVLYKQPISKLVFVLLGSFHVELLESCHERLKEEFIFSRFFLVFIHLDTKWHTALSGLEHYDWLFTFSFSLSGTATMNLLESKNMTGPWKWASLKTGPAFWGMAELLYHVSLSLHDFFVWQVSLLPKPAGKTSRAIVDSSKNLSDLAIAMASLTARTFQCASGEFDVTLWDGDPVRCRSCIGSLLNRFLFTVEKVETTLYRIPIKCKFPVFLFLSLHIDQGSKYWYLIKELPVLRRNLQLLCKGVRV